MQGPSHANKPLSQADVAQPAGGDGHTLDPFYVLAPSAVADEHALVLKQGDTFAVLDHYGDIKPVGLGEEGLYHEGTRFLSRLVLLLAGRRPLYLSSTVTDDNGLLTADLTNPDVRRGEELLLPRGTLHLFRSRFLWHAASYERLHLRNYGPEPMRADLTFQFAADYADIFEVRGTHRPRRGQIFEAQIGSESVDLAYRGLDGVIRKTRLQFTPAPAHISGASATFHVELEPQAELNLFLTIHCQTAEAPTNRLAYQAALAASSAALSRARDDACAIGSSNEQFNEWVNRSGTDLAMMITETPRGPYPYAGVPWFSTPFGRDGIITALECLWMNPRIARGVLEYLASTQATEVIPEQDAEPGKILHETRGGEMAALGEVPFGRYYGSVDATPLFVHLAWAYYERTADKQFVESIWPQVQSALEWIDDYGDADRDGFVEYARHSPQGLVHQGWKDSHDAVFHADAASAAAPIALAEVQGYVYAARRGAARLAALLGESALAARLDSEAHSLKKQFQKAFWCDELSTYALALDGSKQPCRVRSSNAGHCLMTGIASDEQARCVARTLLADESFSGWGVRTISASEVRFNPMSYHNGSVWPHDNALVAYGFSRYRLKDEVTKVFTGMFDASLFVNLHRMPELFCGFPRRAGEGPTLYPVACAPQAWAAGAVYLLLQACLGLHIDATQRRITFFYPQLPPSLQEIRLDNLRVAGAEVDVLLRRHGDDVSTNVTRREGRVEVVVVK